MTDRKIQLLSKHGFNKKVKTCYPIIKYALSFICSESSLLFLSYLTLFRIGLLGLLSKICHKNLKIHKSVTYFLSFAGISIFSQEISNFFYIKKYICRLHFNTYFLILLTLFESLKVLLINMVSILIISANLATLDQLKITIFWKKAYGVIIFVHDVTNKNWSRYQIILYMWSCAQSLVTVAFLWEKLS